MRLCWRKLNPSVASVYQLPVALVRVGACVHFSLSTGTRSHLTFMGPVHAASVSEST